MANLNINTTTNQLEADGTSSLTIDPAGSETVAINNGLLIPDGTKTAPSVRFADDANTGIYSPVNEEVAITGSGEIAFRTVGVVSGVNYARITNAATGNPVLLETVGTDTNIDLNLVATGTGLIKLGTLPFDPSGTVGAGQDNYVLTYDNATGKIGLEASAGGSTSLAALTDTTITAGAKGDILVHNGTAWVDGPAVGANDTILTADSAQATGVKWAAAGGGATGYAYGGTVTTAPSATGEDSIVIGDGATDEGGSNNVVIGPLSLAGNNANGKNVIIGYNNDGFSGNGNIIIGIGNKFGSNQSGRIWIDGNQNPITNSNGSKSIAIGDAVRSPGAGSIALGDRAYTPDTGAISIGASSDASQAYSVAIGQSSQATGVDSIAIGGDSAGSVAAAASGAQSIAIGNATDATAINSIAIGTSATASASPALAILDSTVTAIGSVGIMAGNITKIGVFSVNGNGLNVAPNTFQIGQTDKSSAFQATDPSAVGMSIQYASTTNATITEMAGGDTPGSTTRFILGSNQICQFTAHVVGAKTGTIGDVAAYTIKGTLLNNAGTMTLKHSTVTVDVEDNAATDCIVAADSTNKSIKISVTGIAAENWSWSARIDWNLMYAL